MRDPVERQKHRSSVRLAAKRLREKDREEFNRKQREFRASHKTELRAYDKARLADKTHRWRSNPDTLAKYRKRNAEYAKRKRRSDMNFRLADVLRSRLAQAVRLSLKKTSALTLIGCSLDELKSKLESQFRPGMEWSNYGRGPGKWNIDHIIPCAAFDLSDFEEQKKCFHWSNLQPLWSIENSSKNARLDYHLPVQFSN